MDPFPSIWGTSEMQALESRTSSTRARHHQCVFGAPRPKATCVSGTLDELVEMDQQWCPWESATHKHYGPSQGRDSSGQFCTRRLQTYCPGYSKEIATRIFRTAQRLLQLGQGPTGPLRTGEKVVRSSQYGFRHRGDNTYAVSLLNEDVSNSRQVLLDTFQAAAYLHVDDVVCLSTASAGAVHADNLMLLISEALEAVGFTVPDSSRRTHDTIDKVIGYSYLKGIGRFTVASDKYRR